MKFDDARIERLASGAGRTPQVAGRYARLVVRRASETILVIGVSEAESQVEVDGIAAAGIVWLTRFNERRGEKERARTLALCQIGRASCRERV